MVALEYPVKIVLKSFIFEVVVKILCHICVVSINPLLAEQYQYRVRGVES